ncbi:ubiquinol-cytochrome c reductase, iron-sulfur subunit [Legionella busanensis]|uniref:Ubiquinol-cytochrome c reductase iron-sulfur subunit n=1 Tax=Legionella busanensis TaxID=190655 RepID=A0A378JN90_9GAMM|nr:ubiquinol-cytochrome c reductase iron-sulfur subunit [Legionella busanensis]STX52547.1 ubiquinol-cytochrome c reductase, iron-sulfur subunit [Legionella busanensis]
MTDDNEHTPDVLLSQEEIDEKRRKFLLTATGVLGGIGAACALTPFISSWLPSAKAQAAGAPVEVDLSKLEPGQQATIEWRGRPVWIIRRTKAMLEQLAGAENQLRDPESLVEQQPSYAKNKYRSIKPEYLVLVGICTHLGCSPKYTPQVNELGPNWRGGFYCPCHGSTFDLAGRVFKGVPAPINLEVPPYRFVNDHVIIIGEDEQQG